MKKILCALMLPLTFVSCSSFKGAREIAQQDNSLTKPLIEAHGKANGVHQLVSGSKACPTMMDLMWSQGEVGKHIVIQTSSNDMNFGYNVVEVNSGTQLYDRIYSEVDGLPDWGIPSGKEKFYHSKGAKEQAFIDGTFSASHQEEVRAAKIENDKTFKGRKYLGRTETLLLNYSNPEKLSMRYFLKKDRTLSNLLGKHLELECQYNKVK